MNIIQEIESIKYRYVIDLIQKEEQYDKKKRVITGDEAFKECYNRYLLLQQILNPIKEKLGGEVDVTDITLSNGIDDEMGILIKYQKNGRQQLLSISSLDYQDIRIVSSDEDVKMNNFGYLNRRIIIKAFKDIIGNSLDEKIEVKSTSGKFVIRDNCDSFSIRSLDEKVFSIENKYLDYEKNGDLLTPTKLDCNFPKLKELLTSNGLALYQHLRIYDDVFPKEVIKKLTYR